jgi:hypothetical protein
MIDRVGQTLPTGTRLHCTRHHVESDLGLGARDGGDTSHFVWGLTTSWTTLDKARAGQIEDGTRPLAPCSWFAKLQLLARCS